MKLLSQPRLAVIVENAPVMRKSLKDQKSTYTACMIMKVCVTLTTEKNPLHLMLLAADEGASIRSVQPVMFNRFGHN